MERSTVFYSFGVFEELGVFKGIESCTGISRANGWVPKSPFLNKLLKIKEQELCHVMFHLSAILCYCIFHLTRQIQIKAVEVKL